jgi:hypothetical protein
MHQYAHDTQGRWVNAKQTIYEKYQVYYCDCPEKHKLKLVKPSGITGKRPFCDYFAHQTIPDKRQRVNETCSQGESLVHRLAKHKLRETVGSYFFPVFRCQCCRKETIVDSLGGSVDIEVSSSDKLWRYDCLLKIGHLAVAMEVVHTHLTGSIKVESTRRNGIEIAEFKAENVMKMPSFGITKLENLKMKTGKCQGCLHKAAYCWLRDCFVDELNELIRQENEAFENYTYADQKRKEREIRRTLLQNALQINDPCQKCKQLIALSLGRLHVSIPQLGTISFTKAVECHKGLLVYGFNRPLPTTAMFIYLIDSDRNTMQAGQWKHDSVERVFHIFLHCSTIVRDFGTLEENIITLKDCRWPILKDLEANYTICANCGRHGHCSIRCRFTMCLRCGRTGHLLSNCFARKDVTNRNLL